MAMTKNEELELGEAINTIMDRYGLKGHAVVYLDDNKFKFMGNISMAALAPIFLKMMAERLSK